MATNEIVQTYLQFPESIRQSPGMYVGATNEPSLIWREVFDNAVDCAVDPKLGNDTVLSIVEDTFFLVKDNGPGLPCYIDTSVENEPIPACLGIFTRLHYGSKSGADASAATSGLHGIGVTATNALSSYMSVIINLRRVVKAGRAVSPVFDVDDDIAVLLFERGILTSMESKKYTDWHIKGVPSLSDDFGTLIIVQPDPEIWATTRPQINPIVPALIKSSLKSRGTKCDLSINGEEIKPFTLQQAFPKAEFLLDLVHSFSGSINGLNFEAAFAYCKTWDTASTGSVNGNPALQGPHVNACIGGVSKAMSDMHASLSARDCKPALRCFVQVSGTGKFRYDSQTKSRLSEIKGVSTQALTQAITTALLESLKGSAAKKQLKQIVEVLFQYKKASGNVALNESIASDIQTAEGGASLRGEGVKIFDLVKPNRKTSELFLVEGLSAAGSLVNLRDKTVHAILPLRGKIINTAKASTERAFDNKEVKTLFRVLGCGVESVNFKLSAMRYNKVIIGCDSDPDGSNIRALILAAFCRYAPQLIEEGRVYALITPLYKQNDKYIYAEADLDRNKAFKRFKGLGALENKDVTATIFGPDRHLIQMTADDIAGAINLIGQGGPKKRLMQARGFIE